MGCLINFCAWFRPACLGARPIGGEEIPWQGIGLALVGEGVGILASVALGRLLSSLLYGARNFGAETILLTMTILGIAATTAALIPAYPSTRVQPMTALRTE